MVFNLDAILLGGIQQHWLHVPGIEQTHLKIMQCDRIRQMYNEYILTPSLNQFIILLIALSHFGMCSLNARYWLHIFVRISVDLVRSSLFNLFQWNVAQFNQIIRCVFFCKFIYLFCFYVAVIVVDGLLIWCLSVRCCLLRESIHFTFHWVVIAVAADSANIIRYEYARINIVQIVQQINWSFLQQIKSKYTVIIEIDLGNFTFDYIHLNIVKSYIDSHILEAYFHFHSGNLEIYLLSLNIFIILSLWLLFFVIFFLKWKKSIIFEVREPVGYSFSLFKQNSYTR